MLDATDQLGEAGASTDSTPTIATPDSGGMRLAGKAKGEQTHPDAGSSRNLFASTIGHRLPMVGPILLGFVLGMAVTGAREAELPSSTAMMNELYDLGEISVAAPRCGVRDKIWATRLVGHVLAAINGLDPNELEQATNLRPGDLEDDLNSGQQNATWVLQNRPDTFCAEKVSPTTLDQADKIVTDQAPVW